MHVWQKSRLLVNAVYELTGSYPSAERFGLTQQTRSAATSVAANIAEGCGRYGRKEFARFLSMSLGSAFELESHLELARHLGYAGKDDAEGLQMEIDAFLVRLHRFIHATRQLPR